MWIKWDLSFISLPNFNFGKNLEGIYLILFGHIWDEFCTEVINWITRLCLLKMKSPLRRSEEELF